MICYKSMCDLHHKRDCIFLMHGPYLVPMFSTVFFFLKTLESLVSQEQAQIIGPSTTNYFKH